MAIAVLPHPKGPAALMAFVSGRVRYGLRDADGYRAFIEVHRHGGWHEVISAEVGDDMAITNNEIHLLGQEPPTPSDNEDEAWSPQAMAGLARSLRSGAIAGEVADLALEEFHPLAPDPLVHTIRSLATLVRSLRVTTSGRRPCQKTIPISTAIAGEAFTGALFTVSHHPLSAANEALWREYKRRYPDEDHAANYPNGCTLSPDFNFTDCCDRHDIRYTIGGDEDDRERADDELYYCIEGRAGWWIAGIYWAAVRSAGSNFFTYRF